MGSKRGLKKGLTKRFYPEEVKQEVIWMKWYRDGETNRLAKNIGRPNSSTRK